MFDPSFYLNTGKLAAMTTPLPVAIWTTFERSWSKLALRCWWIGTHGYGTRGWKLWPTIIAELKSRGHHVIVVSSGAIFFGRIVLGNRSKPPTPDLRDRTLKLNESQAAAAIGQIELSRAYSEVLAKRGLGSGQILLTLGDTENRRRYLNARSTVRTLLDWGAVPVINENDSVATQEFATATNDRLAARVATMMNAELLILLSDIDGLYKQASSC